MDRSMGGLEKPTPMRRLAFSLCLSASKPTLYLALPSAYSRGSEGGEAVD